MGSIQSRLTDQDRNRFPITATAIPINGPSVTCKAANQASSRAAPGSVCMLAKVASTSTTGSAIPSLRPLSTLSACRTRTGTPGLLTTACPSAASVGASTAPSTAASSQLNSGSSNLATTAPRPIVSGNPMPSKRTGRPSSCRSAYQSMRAASPKRTKINVSSARMCIAPCSTFRCSHPSPQGPNNRPHATNTRGGVSEDVAIRFDTKPNAKTKHATKMNAVVSMRQTRSASARISTVAGPSCAIASASTPSSWSASLTRIPHAPQSSAYSAKLGL